jgi:hypothetical protein
MEVQHPGHTAFCRTKHPEFRATLSFSLYHWLLLLQEGRALPTNIGGWFRGVGIQVGGVVANARVA